MGDDALMTCVVQNQRNLTLMWKKETKEKIGTKILTANTERVTGDPRVSIIHEEGGQVRHIRTRTPTGLFRISCFLVIDQLSGVRSPDQECDSERRWDVYL